MEFLETVFQDPQANQLQYRFKLACHFVEVELMLLSRGATTECGEEMTGVPKGDKRAFFRVLKVPLYLRNSSSVAMLRDGFITSLLEYVLARNDCYSLKWLRTTVMRMVLTVPKRFLDTTH